MKTVYLISLLVLGVVSSYSHVEEFLFEAALLVRQGGLRDRLQQRAQLAIAGLDTSSSCSFQDFIATSCTIDEYCVSLQARKESFGYKHVFCSFNSSKSRHHPSTQESDDDDDDDDWSIELSHPEWCYADLLDMKGLPYREETFDAEVSSFCSQETIRLVFTAGGVLLREEFTMDITRPWNSGFEGISKLESCHHEAPMYTFGGRFHYCYAACPESLVINGIACQPNCISCPNSLASGKQQGLDCSTIGPKLIESCDILHDNQEEIVKESLSYVEKVGRVRRSRTDRRNW